MSETGNGAGLTTGNGGKAAPRFDIPSVPDGVVDRRSEELFKTHPLNDSYTSTHRYLVPLPFHGYHLDGTGVVCLADLGEVRRYLQGSGYEPVRVNDRFAIVNLLFNKYYDSSLGPYDALVVTIFGSPKEKRVAWVDPSTLLMPQFDQSVVLVFGPYAMSPNTRALDIGRDRMGMNKLEANARIHNYEDRTTATIVGGFGKPLLYAEVQNPKDYEAKAYWESLQAQLKNEHGAPFLEMLKLGGPSPGLFVGYDPSTRLPPVTTQTFVSSRPAFKPWSPDDVLELAPGIHVTDLLLRFNAKPWLTTRDPHMAAVLVPPAPTPSS